MAGPPTLDDNAASSNAQGVRFLLAELGPAFARREVAASRPRPGWYLEVPPRADPGARRRRRESHAILSDLAAREGRDDLSPMDDLAGRARVEELLDRFCAARSVGTRWPCSATCAASVGWGAAPPDPERAARIEEEIQDELALLDGLLGARFAVLERFTIADCALAPARALRTGLNLGGFPGSGRCGAS